MRARQFSFALIGAALLLGGCATSGSAFQQPAVELTSVTVADMSFSAQTFVLGFNVQNPNAFPLPVKRVRYRVRLNDQNFASGETEGRFSVPAAGEGSFSISVDLDLMRSGPQLALLLRSGVEEELRYELHGDLSVDLPISPTLRFSDSGRIPLQAWRR